MKIDAPSNLGSLLRKYQTYIVYQKTSLKTMNAMQRPLELYGYLASFH